MVILNICKCFKHAIHILSPVSELYSSPQYNMAPYFNRKDILLKSCNFLLSKITKSLDLPKSQILNATHMDIITANPDMCSRSYLSCVLHIGWNKWP